MRGMRQCRPAGEVAKLAEPAFGPGGEALQQGPGIIGRAQGMVALICAEELDRAEAIAAADLTAARARGAMFELGLNTLFLAVAGLFRGAIRDSEAGARLVLELVGEHGFPAEVATAGAVLVESLTEQGDRDAAWAELEALGMAGELPELNTFSWVLAARGSLRAAGGEYEAALEDLAEAGRRLASWGVSDPAEGRWRSDAALAHLRLGRRDRAVALADEELELVRAFGTPRAVGVALRARGLVEGGDRGIELLAEAAEILAGSVARLEQARALIDLGAALRRANRRSEARSSLKKGLALARRCGAVPLAEFAHVELEASGARPRKIVRSGVDALTPSERRVARMAAAGAANKEIAQALFITTRHGRDPPAPLLPEARDLVADRAPCRARRPGGRARVIERRRTGTRGCTWSSLMRTARRASIVAAMDAEPTQFTIELTAAAEPIAGRIEAVGGEARGFAGYIGLIAALEALTGPPAPPPARTEGSG